MATFVSGQVPTAAELNAITTDIVSSLGAWTAYSPSWTSLGTQPSLGNGTLTGAYQKIGRTVLFKISLTAGGTTTFGTNVYLFSLPFASADPGLSPHGTACIQDSSAGQFNRHALLWTATTVLLQAEAGTNVTNTVPMTWASGDKVNIKGMYEATS